MSSLWQLRVFEMRHFMCSLCLVTFAVRILGGLVLRQPVAEDRASSSSGVGSLSLSSCVDSFRRDKRHSRFPVRARRTKRPVAEDADSGWVEDDDAGEGNLCEGGNPVKAAKTGESREVKRGKDKAPRGKKIRWTALLDSDLVDSIALVSRRCLVSQQPLFGQLTLDIDVVLFLACTHTCVRV